VAANLLVALIAIGTVRLLVQGTLLAGPPPAVKAGTA
jgi:hypothetical protein